MRLPTQIYFEDKKNFYKRNYVKATEIITPKFYLEYDNQLGGQDINVLDEIVNTHINIASKYSDIIISGIGGILAVADSPYSNINQIQGLSQFFIKQNNLTNIDANDFERNILLPLGTSLNNFTTSAEFRTYLTTELLPSIRLSVTSEPSQFPVLNSIDGDTLLDGTYNQTSLNKHSYFLTTLSWLYILNVSGPLCNGYDLIADAIIDTIWSGKNFMLNDAMKCLTEYIFRNYPAKPDWEQYNFLPRYYKPNLNLPDTTYTSGLQQLDKLKTLIDVIYSPLYSDRGDTKVKEAFEQFIENQIFLNDVEIQGPFYKFLKAISYSFADYNNSIELLEILNDVNKCPDKFIPYIADLLGWRLLGSESQKWRVQLINAVSIYKMVGTKKGLQTVVDYTFSQELFNASAQIEDLWESYLPNLIYYCLATESSLFKDFSTWTRQKADELAVTYSFSSLDESIRCAVDKIILDTANRYSFNFWVNGVRTPIDNSSCVFNYRGRDYKVPPFEEYPFYINQKLSKSIIDFIVDKLICFGVPELFADQLGSFIKQNTIDSLDDNSLGYSWLIFTNESKYPPNWDQVILDISNKKSEYLSLWNGKSSHFKIFLDINSFKFLKDSLLINSIEGLRILNEIIDEFSPAHSIKQLYFRIYESDFKDYGYTSLPLIFIDKSDSPQLNESDSVGFSNYEVSGSNIRSYKRGLTSNYNVISRDKVDSLTDAALSGVISAPRKSFRRRNYSNILDTEGLYVRDGFNMPTTFDMTIEETSYSSLGFLPLGLIPSSQTYIPISGIQVSTGPSTFYESWRDFPAIYSICQGLNSSSVFSGLDVSNTFPCRGLKTVDFLSQKGDYTNDRGQLNQLFRAMHYILDLSNYVMASALIDTDSSLIQQFYIDSIQSLANKLSNSSVSKYSQYEDFKFGKEFHKLHRVYCTYFNRHPLSKKLFDLDGPNLLAHTFGSIYRNSKFNILGPAYSINSNYITSSLLNEIQIRPNQEYFPAAGGGVYNSFVVSSPNKFSLSQLEIGSSSILSGVELIHTITEQDNYFSLYKLSGVEATFSELSSKPYFIQNSILKIKNNSAATLPRVRFDLKTYNNPISEGHPLNENFLIPEHNFKINLRTLITSDDLLRLGNGIIGVWIHTSYENGGTWTYTPKNKWEFVNSNQFNIQNVKNIYCHRFSLPEKLTDLTLVQRNCRNNFLTKISLYDIQKNDFNELTLKFNTKNQPISVPEFYYKTYQQVHRKDQNYYIEIFLFENEDKALYLDEINVINDTMFSWSQPLVVAYGNQFPIGDFNRIEYRVPLNKERLYHIFKYFTSITGNVSQLGLASRIPAMTAPKFEANGGSRLNYRLDPSWLPNTKVSYGFDLINYLEIEN